MFSIPKMKYKVNEITPKKMLCTLVTCPSIYEVTPKKRMCVGGACNGIYDKQERYYIIGNKVGSEELKELGLEKKVGKGEVMIKVDKKLIDEKQKLKFF
jgi:hypothetical protein